MPLQYQRASPCADQAAMRLTAAAQVAGINGLGPVRQSGPQPKQAGGKILGSGRAVAGGAEGTRIRAAGKQLPSLRAGVLGGPLRLGLGLRGVPPGGRSPSSHPSWW
ncbi:hypothetical protein GCM10010273_55620 [Streptomyces lavendulocolor]